MVHTPGGNVLKSTRTGLFLTAMLSVLYGFTSVARAEAMHTKVFFANMSEPRIQVTLKPDPFVRKELPNFPPPTEKVYVYLPVYPEAKPTAPVPNIADMGTPMTSNLVDGTLYFISKDSERQIKLWYKTHFERVGYKQNGSGQIQDNGRTISSDVAFTKNGRIPGSPTYSPDIDLGFLTPKRGKETIYKLKALYIIIPVRPRDSYLPTDVMKVVLTQGHKTKIIMNRSWISHIVQLINSLQVTPPGISMGGPTTLNGVNGNVLGKFYTSNSWMVSVKFMLPDAGVIVGKSKVLLHDTITLEDAILGVFKEQ